MLDHDWGREAFRRFPDLLESFDSVETPHALWIELTYAFQQAYRPPCNEELIARIYAFAEWCCSQPQGKTADDDLATCACVCFFEHIPTIPAAREDMPRWFSRADVLLMKDTFSYLVGEEGFRSILDVYDRRR